MRTPRRRSWARVAAWTGVALAATAVAAYCGAFMWIESKAATAPAVARVRYLDQGWGTAGDAPARETFYFTPQGVPLRNIPYDWLVNLERPWKTDRFAAARYMRGYGFIMADRPLPVGFAQRWDPARGENMVDLTCALCHTGELDVRKNGVLTAIRIDGGPAMHDLGATRPGQFSADLLASLTATYLDPLKFRRFAARVLGKNDTWANWRGLHAELGAAIRAIGGQALLEQRLHLYPVLEGPGRTDALGRIANTVFATHLDPHNYHVADAPVSYPPLWDIWKFDWVQYTASVRQPMARNLGESLGTGADLSLLDKYGRPVPAAERYLASSVVPNLRLIETTLQTLKEPCWPQDVLGPINLPLAREGAQIFADVCQTCHGPHEAPAIVKAFDAPGKTADQPVWEMHTLDANDIGTDPTAALNFVNNRYDLSATGLTPEEVRAQLALTWAPNYARQLTLDQATMQASARGSADYQRAQAEAAHLQAEGVEGYVAEQTGTINLHSVSTAAGLTDLIAFLRPRLYSALNIAPEAQAEWNGFGQLDTPLAAVRYKARPLGGVWATAPYLHNGSVPNLYEMVSPAYEREKVFYLGSRIFDPVKVGFETGESGGGSFRYDTSIPGNFNVGHEFRAGYQPWCPGSPPAHGVIGPEFTPHQRLAIIEYLKVHRDDEQDHSCAVTVPLPPPTPVKTSCTSPAPAYGVAKGN